MKKLVSLSLFLAILLLLVLAQKSRAQSSMNMAETRIVAQVSPGN